MASVILDFYDEDAPSTLLGSLTDADLETYEHRPALFDIGALVFRVPKATAAANSNLLRKTNLVRTRYPTPAGSSRTWVGVLKDYRTVVVSAKEGGGEYVEWTAAGGLFMLSYAQLGTTPYAPGQPALGSLTEVPARDWVWVNEPPGAIITRCIEEGQNEPGEPLDGITIDFDRVLDSAGNAWATMLEEFRVPIGSNILDVIARLATAGDIFLVLDPDLSLHAYQSYDDFTTDRTGGAFGAGVVRWQDGPAGNILTELARASDAIPATHMHQRDSDGNTSTEVYSGYTSGRGHYLYGEADTNDDSTLNKIAQRAMQATRADDERISFEVIPGDDEAAGEYFPTPDGLGGHWYNGDLVTVDTGSDDYDLEDAALRVVAHRIVLDKASKSATAQQAYRSLHIVPELAYRPVHNYTTDRNPSLGGSGTTPGCACLRLCQEGYAGTSATIRLYHSSDVASIQPSPDAAWEQTSDAGTVRTLKAAPDSTYTGGGSGIVTTGSGLSGGRDILLWSGVYGPLSSAEAALIAAGGLSILGYARTRMRYGIGVSEASQHGIANLGVRVTVGASTTIRGTAKALHALASTAGSSEWYPGTPPRNRLFSAAADTADTLSAVAGTVAGDYLVIEQGVRNFTTAGVTGANLYLMSAESDDLPATEDVTTNLNTWIDLTLAGAGATEGCPVMDTVRQGLEALGTCECAAHGDHQHAHGLLSTDGTNYHELSDISGYVHFAAAAPTSGDDEADGYHEGTHWIDTTTGYIYIATSVTVGAATWVQFGVAADLAAHIADTTDAHDASAISVLDTGANYTATDVEAALAEIADRVDALPTSTGIGEILISDTPSTPLVFADLIQNEAEDDLVYADP